MHRTLKLIEKQSVRTFLKDFSYLSKREKAQALGVAGSGKSRPSAEQGAQCRLIIGPWDPYLS